MCKECYIHHLSESLKQPWKMMVMVVVMMMVVVVAITVWFILAYNYYNPGTSSHLILLTIWGTDIIPHPQPPLQMRNL